MSRRASSTGVQQVFSHHGLMAHFWWLVGLEAALNVISGLLTRAVDYSDSLLADRYTHFVSVRVMRQAAELDLTTYEDPVFYDRLERARVQATDRLAMIQQMGRLFQQTLTTVIWTSILLWYSPWLVLLLALGVLPTFLGETHFAFLGYAKNFQADAGQAADGLPAAGCGQPRRRERTEALST